MIKKLKQWLRPCHKQLYPQEFNFVLLHKDERTQLAYNEYLLLNTWNWKDKQQTIINVKIYDHMGHIRAQYVRVAIKKVKEQWIITII